MCDFIKSAPENLGISSSEVLRFLSVLDEYKMHTHSVLMARGDRVFAESYYTPFNKNTLHRMYSVSKSFVAVAIGMAITEKLISLDDAIIKYFPEFQNENIDEYYEKCTVKDMLMMRSNIGTSVYWWGKFASRIEAYYSQKTDKIAGGLFEYDSIGSFLLGCIIQKLTGKDFLEYLKEKALLEIGFSKESYVLYEPGGYAVGDSGVMCTTRDLFLFARFIMKGGNWNGKQYVDKAFMQEAIAFQTDNNHIGSYDLYSSRGYGYLIWKTHKDGFSLVGMGDQLAICDMKKDITFIITSDNQGEKALRHVIYHEFYNYFLKNVKDEAISSDEKSYQALVKYLNSRKLVALEGKSSSSLANKVFDKQYVKEKGELDIEAFCLTKDSLLLKLFGKWHTLEYGVLENKQTKFSFGNRARSDMMGIYEEGKYDCNVSSAWINENSFSTMVQVTDTYFGCMNIQISFQDDQATMLIRRSGQYVFPDIDGFMIAKTNK